MLWKKDGSIFRCLSIRIYNRPFQSGVWGRGEGKSSSPPTHTHTHIHIHTRARVQTGPGANTASCAMGTGAFCWAIAAEGWRKPTLFSAEVQTMARESYCFTPSVPSWFVSRENFTLSWGGKQHGKSLHFGSADYS